MHQEGLFADLLCPEEVLRLRLRKCGINYSCCSGKGELCFFDATLVPDFGVGGYRLTSFCHRGHMRWLSAIPLCSSNMYFEAYARTVARSSTWFVMLTLGDTGEFARMVCIEV